MLVTGVYSLALTELFSRAIFSVCHVREHMPVDLSKVSIDKVANLNSQLR
jgi:hypothetical protein